MLDNEAANNDPSKSSDKESCWLLYCLTKRVAEANPLSMDTPQKLPNPYLIGIHSLYAGYISDTSEAYPENKIKKKKNSTCPNLDTTWVRHHAGRIPQMSRQINHN